MTGSPHPFFKIVMPTRIGKDNLVTYTSGKFTDFKSNHMLVKNYSVVGLHWGNYRKVNPELVERTWRELMDLYKLGLIRPLVEARYPMEKIADAMAFLSSRKAVGKIILHW